MLCKANMHTYNITSKYIPPLFLEENRPSAIRYAGGEKISQFRGTKIRHNAPEDWVASLTSVPSHFLGSNEPYDTGVSYTEYGSLRNLVESDPVYWLGNDIVDVFGGNSGLLVKLLDAGQRLPVHCHPTRSFAQTHLNNIFGKTEGWIVMYSPPGGHVWLGMRDAVDRHDLRRWIETEDVDSILSAMNRVNVKRGDVIYIPAGLPHSIGSGIMVTELQEPTTFNIFADYWNIGVNEETATNGLGWDIALSCFDLSSYEYCLDELISEPQPLSDYRHKSRDRIISLFPPRASIFFRAWQVECCDRITFPEATFCILIVIDGAGRLEWEDGSAEIRKGQTLVIPEGIGRIGISGEVTSFACLPPEID